MAWGVTSAWLCSEARRTQTAAGDGLRAELGPGGAAAGWARPPPPFSGSAFLWFLLLRSRQDKLYLATALWNVLLTGRRRHAVHSILHSVLLTLSSESVLVLVVCGKHKLLLYFDMEPAAVWEPFTCAANQQPRTGGRRMPCRAPVGPAMCQEARGPGLLLACDTGDILKHSVKVTLDSHREDVHRLGAHTIWFHFY